MIIKDKEIISIGTTLFNDVHQFKPVTTQHLDHCRAELMGHWTQNEIRENFTSFEIFRSKMVDFMYLRFNSVPLSEIQHSLELSDMQLSILLNIFGYMSKQIIAVLENAYSEGV